MAAKSKLDTQLEKLDLVKEDQIQGTVDIAKSSAEKDADTRQEMAMLCFRAYFRGIILILIGVPMFNLVTYSIFGNTDVSLNLKDVLLTYQAVIGALIGAVAAYYFKNQADNSSN